jgi:hypothetical protein
MNFTFLHRPEPRKYGYKPQFHVPEDQKPVNEKDFDPDKFGDKLRSNWERKRRARTNTTGNIRVVIWIAFLLVLLLVVAWKFRHYLFDL